MKKTQADTRRNLYSRVWKQLQSLPGVRGLGIGMRGWRIYIEAGLNCDAVPFPAAIAGFPTEIIPQQTTFLCYGNEFQATLQPGIQISGKGISGAGAGSIGCFARLTSDHKTIVLLTVSHVLYKDVQSGSGDGNECGQPKVCCCCCCTSHVIGRNRGNGSNGYNKVTVDYKHPTIPDIGESTGSEIDCGVAVLNNSRPYTNESQYYGMITGTPPSGSLGVSAGDTVEKVGSTTGHTKGTICQFNFTSVKYEAGGSGSIPSVLFPIEERDKSTPGSLTFINQLMVIPDPDSNDPLLEIDFALPGDSGSVVVNSTQQVVGLVTAIVPLNAALIAKYNPLLTSPIPPHAGSLTFVCPIGKVLTSLGIEIVDNMKGTVTTAGPVLTAPDDVLQHRERVLAMVRTLEALECELRDKAVGRKVLERIKEHRPELERLVEQKRAVKVAWNRCHGPAYAAHCLRSFEDERYVVPSEVDGVTPVELIQKMARVLKTHGSDRLQHDVAHYELLALELIAGSNSVWQLIDRLRKLDPVASADEDEVEVIANAGVSELKR